MIDNFGTPNYDLALDFVETEVGANNFSDNWRRFSNKQDKVRRWLVDLQEDPSSTDAIIAIIDELAATGTSWLTPFTAPIPPEV